MYEIFTYGRFEVPSENEDAFVAKWSEFAAWVSTQPGAQTLRLARDTRNAGRFMSFGQWDERRRGSDVEELRRVQAAAGADREARRRSSSRRARRARSVSWPAT